jgi:catechol 2,3-dioxygenase-like lactoylglutathione lyase family enzyme
MLKRLDHIDLRVLDVEEQVAYFKKLGFVEIRRTPEPRYSVEVALPGPNQVVLEVRAGEAGKMGINHIAFKVEGAESIEQLKSQGIQFNVERRLVKDTGRTVSNFTDPNGNRLQLTD